MSTVAWVVVIGVGAIAAWGLWRISRGESFLPVVDVGGGGASSGGGGQNPGGAFAGEAGAMTGDGRHVVGVSSTAGDPKPR